MDNIKVSIPKEVYEVLDYINSKNYEAYLVGGLIRDTLLGIPSKDYDVTTNMPLEMIKDKYNNFTVMRENDHRNTGILKIAGYEIEISTYRGETIEEDLFERDFRMNALICDKEGTIIDKVEGIADIESKKINLLKENGYGFVFDPLRIMRAIRFAATFDFEITEETNYEMQRKINLLEDVAKERIYTEFKKILVSDYATKVINNYRDVFEYLIPNFEKMESVMQNHPCHFNESVLEHTLIVFDNVEKNVVTRMAALFHDIGKVKCHTVGEDGYDHFHGHANESVIEFNEFAKDIKMDYETKDAVSIIIKNHDARYKLSEEKEIKRFLSKMDLKYLDNLFDLMYGDVLGQNKNIHEEELKRLEDFKAKCKKILDEEACLSVKDLCVNGTDLVSIGFEGKEIGLMLNEFLDKIIDEELLNDKDMLMEYALERRRDLNEN